MTSAIIEQVCNFRNSLFNLFSYRRDSSMDLIDAIAGQPSKDSTVKVSLSNLFRRGYSSITDVVDNFFRTEAEVNPKPEDLRKSKMKITQLIAKQCPNLFQRRFHLFAVDCSTSPRIYADKLEDRSFVHAPTKVPGQIPITIGHQYSTLVYLPERFTCSEAHWVIPLSNERVTSKANGTIAGMEQIIDVVTDARFKDDLCLAVSDSAYSHAKCNNLTAEIDNLVCASRMRNNRVFRCKLPKFQGVKKRGRPKIYGDPWSLKDPKTSDETIIIEHQTASGRFCQIKIEQWRDKTDHGKNSQSDKNKDSVNKQESSLDFKEEQIVFDAIKVTALTTEGKPVYKKPLWIMVTGKRKQEISLEDVARSYLQRFDIEHFFRFSKQKLLLTDFQTPDVRHEENWWWLSMLSYVMLYLCRYLGDHIRYPWEKKLENKKNGIRTPSQVQRSYERIIRQIGTPARDSKPRGKSPGRPEGCQMAKRKDYPVVKKTKTCVSKEVLVAA